MHELSLALEVIELVQREAGKQGLSAIQEILIEVGDLSGVEADAFQSALELLVKNTILNDAVVKIIQTHGKGICAACNKEFEMKNRLDTCPGCLCFPSEITGGKEFRVLSLLAE
ncbi:MAG: hydrogenase maturation nickel metallochaperone HypA [Bacteroidetes bacterium]|nr:hydrogenase maturation nickel metallochaperone HypA [Bacteroidota bacterium]